MAQYLRVDINVAAAVTLAFVLLIAHQNIDRGESLNKLFQYTAWAVLLQLVFETSTCLINGKPEQWLIPLSIFLHSCLFITAPVLTYCWYAFLRRWVDPENPVSIKQEWILRTFVIINTVFVLASPRWGFIFTISEDNHYARGPLFPLSGALIYIYLLLALIMVYKNRKRLIQDEFMPMLIFGILPIVGGVLQGLYYGVLLMWSTTAFSLIIVFYYIQQRTIHLDSLTGAWSRNSFNFHIRYLSRSGLIDGNAFLFIDLDRLKDINDQYGHLEGDYALKTTVELIRQNLRKSDIIGRFGGDEFVVVFPEASTEQLEKITYRIQQDFDNYNQNSQKGYTLEYSIGSDIYDAKKEPLNSFMDRVDQQMYDNKAIKRKLRTENTARRTSDTSKN